MGSPEGLRAVGYEDSKFGRNSATADPSHDPPPDRGHSLPEKRSDPASTISSSLGQPKINDSVPFNGIEALRIQPL